MGYQLVTWPMTLRDPEKSDSWLQCYLVCSLCCGAVGSAILATAWFLVLYYAELETMSTQYTPSHSFYSYTHFVNNIWVKSKLQSNNIYRFSWHFNSACRKKYCSVNNFKTGCTVLLTEMRDGCTNVVPFNARCYA